MESEFDKIQQEILETEQSYKVSKRLIELAQKDLDDILSRLNEKDDRKIDGIEIKSSLKAEVNKNIQQWMEQIGNDDINLEYDTELYDYLKDYFDVKDSELALGELHKSRFETEFLRAALKIHLQNLDEQINDLKDNALANYYEIESKPWLYADEEEEEDNEDDDDSPMMANMVPSYDPNVTQFALINKLEKKLRALLKAVLKQQDNWYENYIPKEIKFGLQKRNQKNPNFPELLENKSLELIDLLMFKDYQLIITSNYSQYTLFKNIFPNIHYVTERLIEASIFRNQIAHSNQLAPDQELTLTNLTNELVMHANEYLGVNE